MYTVVRNKKEMYKVVMITVSILKFLSSISSYASASIYASSFNMFTWEMSTKEGFIWYNGFMGFIYGILIISITVAYKSKTNIDEQLNEKEPVTPRRYE